MEFVSVVAYASEGTGGKGFVGSRFLEERGVAHSLGKGGVGRGPREMEVRFVSEEGGAEEEGKKERDRLGKWERAHA